MNSNESAKQLSLAPVFQAACDSLLENQELLNRADLVDGNHGNQMVEVFQLAVQAVEEKQTESLSDAMEYAGMMLETRESNEAAQVYAHGLRQLALQLEEKGISIQELLSFVQNTLRKTTEEQNSHPDSRSGEVIKALVAGLANWERVEQGKDPIDRPVNMGVLFDFGIAYLQAKQLSDERAEILAEAAVSICPIGKSPESKLSGKIAFQALLRAMQAQALV